MEPNRFNLWVNLPIQRNLQEPEPFPIPEEVIHQPYFLDVPTRDGPALGGPALRTQAVPITQPTLPVQGRGAPLINRGNPGNPGNPINPVIHRQDNAQIQQVEHAVRVAQALVNPVRVINPNPNPIQAPRPGQFGQIGQFGARPIPQPVIGTHGRRVAAPEGENFVDIEIPIPEFDQAETRVINACSQLRIDMERCRLLPRHGRCVAILEPTLLETCFSVELLERPGNPNVIVVEFRRLSGVQQVFNYVFRQIRAVLIGEDLRTVPVPEEIERANQGIVIDMTPAQIENTWAECEDYLRRNGPLGLRSVANLVSAGLAVPTDKLERVLMFAKFNSALRVLAVNVLIICFQRATERIPIDLEMLVMVAGNTMIQGENGRRAGCRLITTLIRIQRQEVLELLRANYTQWIELLHQVVIYTLWDETRVLATNIMDLIVPVGGL